MKKIRVLIGGNPYHVSLLAEQINGFSQGIEVKTEQPPWPNNTPRKVIPQLSSFDVYHGIYWEDCYKIFFTAKLLRKKTVCHWIGTDVFNVLRDKKRRLAIKILDKVIDIHLAGSPGLIDELKEIGIEASWIPLLPDNLNTQVNSLPASLTVLSYVPEARPDFYGEPIIHQLAAHFQGVKFVIVGSKGEGLVYPENITYLCYQENMDEIYNNTTVFLRIIKHDGLSLMVLEALARGRQVIWSELFPHCYHAKDFEAAKSALSSIIRNPVINYDAVSYIQEEFNSEKILGRLTNIYDSLLR